MKKKRNAFTLIELLVVVSVIGALTGIVLAIINPVRTQGAARDGIRNKSVKSLAEAIVSYRQLEGAYPSDGDPFDENSLLRTVYIDDWPSPVANDGSIDSDNWSYEYATRNLGDDFVVFSPNANGGCYKYQSDWAQVKDCPLAECDTDISPAGNCP